ncbi:MAG: ribulose-phosphate 3-epimerase [Anaerolineae bacterium]|nr:ribulose-phosphate 3-epimerase [Anaerolineae bacterium]
MQPSAAWRRRPIRLAPSILSADFARLGEQVAEAEAAGADLIHVDVMDGHFVPNITVGPMVVRAVRKATRLPVHVHLMIERPEDFIERFAAAGADLLTVHVEATWHLHRLVERVRDLGKGVGVSLNPATSLCHVEEIAPDVDTILVMTVDPGFGGQALVESTLDKIARLRAMLDQRGLDCDIEVDGGINPDTIARVVAAGANVVVAGAAVFEAPEGIEKALARLRHLATEGNQ